MSQIETTKLILSDNDVEFLPRDLKANRLNVKNCLKEDLPIDDISPNETSLESNTNNDLIDDLIQQVGNEQKSKNVAESKTENLETNSGTIKDFSEIEDVELLAKFGLKIIKQTNIERAIPLEELNQMLEKCKKFAEIYKCCSRVWSFKVYSEGDASQNELHISLKQMLNDINVAFNMQISVTELKRLLNLISFWYVQNINVKFIENKNISVATCRFLNLFSFIPKSGKRFYFCEYCNKYFNTEHKYFCHRIAHTGAVFPYTCQKCFRGYKVLKSLRTHEKSCKPSILTNFQCQICLQKFETSALLYQHSKEHLKTAYNCSKCELVFASAIDVKNHMAICNKSEKHIPKQYTPRPKKQST